MALIIDQMVLADTMETCLCVAVLAMLRAGDAELVFRVKLIVTAILAFIALQKVLWSAF